MMKSGIEPARASRPGAHVRPNPEDARHEQARGADHPLGRVAAAHHWAAAEQLRIASRHEFQASVFCARDDRMLAAGEAELARSHIEKAEYHHRAAIAASIEQMGAFAVDTRDQAQGDAWALGRCSLLRQFD